MEVSGYKLDNNQLDIVKDNSDALLVVAGAGSGKTLTIIGKIKYLISHGIKSNEILCVTFTNAAASSLRDKIIKETNCNIDTFTFHKLAMNIIGNNYEICDNELLDNIVYDFLYNQVINSELMMKYILIYNNISYSKNNYIKFLNSKEIKLFIKKIISFIRLLKCGGYELVSFIKFSYEIKNISYFKYRKEKAFLIIVMNIYNSYQKYLNDNNEVDFDDLIIKATRYVQSNGYHSLKYIIIDEYQDTSFIRFNLIKSIKDSTCAKVMAVGDDYQSIYRFTGCDISLFLDFSKYFDNANIKYITNTYRNSMDLINYASKFIMKNKYQIKKDMISNKRLDKPIVIIKEKDLYSKIDELKNIGSLLILGRNNNDFNKYNLKDNCMTVHKSKGLEADNVIIINLCDDVLGFPNKIKDDDIFRLVTKKNDNYLYSEERRLFYVALTRTKNYVYLVDDGNPSIFLKEIKKIIRK